MRDSRHFTATSMPDRDWWTVLWPDPASVLTQVGVQPGQHIVDLCCGDGWFTAPLGIEVGETGQVIGLDLDSEQLDEARRQVDAHELAQVKLVEGDAMELDKHLDQPVDLVFMANTFHGAPDREALARVVHKVLRPGGRFVVVNWWPRPREETTVLGKPRGPRPELRFSPEQVAEMVEPAGFVTLEVKEVGPYHYGAVFQRRD